MNTGKAILVALAMKEMTRKQLAEAVGLAPETVYSMCKSKNASTRTLLRVAGALGMKVSELVKLGE